MPASLGAEREQIEPDGRRFAYVPVIGWTEVCTAEELLAALEKTDGGLSVTSARRGAGLAPLAGDRMSTLEVTTP